MGDGHIYAVGLCGFCCIPLAIWMGLFFGIGLTDIKEANFHKATCSITGIPIPLEPHLECPKSCSSCSGYCGSGSCTSQSYYEDLGECPGVLKNWSASWSGSSVPRCTGEGFKERCCGSSTCCEQYCDDDDDDGYSGYRSRYLDSQSDACADGSCASNTAWKIPLWTLSSEEQEHESRDLGGCYCVDAQNDRCSISCYTYYYAYITQNIHLDDGDLYTDVTETRDSESWSSAMELVMDPNYQFNTSYACRIDPDWNKRSHSEIQDGELKTEDEIGFNIAAWVFIAIIPCWLLLPLMICTAYTGGSLTSLSLWFGIIFPWVLLWPISTGNLITDTDEDIMRIVGLILCGLFFPLGFFGESYIDIRGPSFEIGCINYISFVPFELAMCVFFPIAVVKSRGGGSTYFACLALGLLMLFISLVMVLLCSGDCCCNLASGRRTARADAGTNDSALEMRATATDVHIEHSRQEEGKRSGGQPKLPVVLAARVVARPAAVATVNPPEPVVHQSYAVATPVTSNVVYDTSGKSVPQGNETVVVAQSIGAYPIVQAYPAFMENPTSNPNPAGK